LLSTRFLDVAELTVDLLSILEDELQGDLSVNAYGDFNSLICLPLMAMLVSSSVFDP
jgi:hypothetical protein